MSKISCAQLQIEFFKNFTSGFIWLKYYHPIVLVAQESKLHPREHKAFKMFKISCDRATSYTLLKFG